MGCIWYVLPSDFQSLRKRNKIAGKAKKRFEKACSFFITSPMYDQVNLRKRPKLNELSRWKAPRQSLYKNNSRSSLFVCSKWSDPSLESLRNYFPWMVQFGARKLACSSLFFKRDKTFGVYGNLLSEERGAMAEFIGAPITASRSSVRRLP